MNSMAGSRPGSVAASARAASASVEVLLLRHSTQFEGPRHVAVHGLADVVHRLLCLQESACDGVLEKGFPLAFEGADLVVRRRDPHLLLVLERGALLAQLAVLSLNAVVGQEGFKLPA